MKVQLVAAAVLASSLAACTTAAAPQSLSLQPVASNGRDLTKLNIKPTSLLESRQPAGEVSIQPTDKLSSYGASFVVAVRNISPSVQDFGPANVSAVSGATPVAIYSPEELTQQIQGKVRARMQTETRSANDKTRDVTAATQWDPTGNGIGLSPVPNSAHDYRFNNAGGCPAGQGRCQIEAPDGGAGYRADVRDRDLNLQTSQEIAAQMMKDMRDVKVTLNAGQIPAGQIGGGVIVLPRPRSGETVTVTVTFAGQPHTFTYKAVPAA